MGIYAETAEKLRVLGLNETKMDKYQFKRYAPVLEKYRKEITAGANAVLKHFWLSGIIVEKGSRMDGLCGKIRGIIEDETAKGEMGRLKGILFQTYSLDKFLDAACMVKNRILYEGYAPYWTNACIQKPLPDGIQWAGIPGGGTAWYNSLIDMYWHDGYGLWVSEDKIAWCMCLPPTRGLCESEYWKGRVVTNA